uniref:Uncharacterized protein n=1 Tax=Magallana gigas TaxID=29159 RepID=K1R7E3_MAGGI
MDIDFLDDEFKIEEIDDLTLSQVCDEMEAFDGLLNMSLTQSSKEKRRISATRLNHCFLLVSTVGVFLGPFG